MTDYELADVLELGGAGSLILDKETMNIDEVSGALGPFDEDLESD